MLGDNDKGVLAKDFFGANHRVESAKTGVIKNDGRIRHAQGKQCLAHALRLVVVAPVVVARGKDVRNLMGKIQVGGGLHPTIEIEVLMTVGEIRHRAQHHTDLMVWHGIDFTICSAFRASYHNPIAYADDYGDQDNSYRHQSQEAFDTS